MYHAGPALQGKRRKKTRVASSDTTEVFTVPHAHPAQDNCIPSSGALSEGLGGKGGCRYLARVFRKKEFVFFI